MDSDVCARLRAARKAANMTQGELAAMLGITGAAYSGYESGRREPSIGRIVQIANILKIPVSELAVVSASEEERLCADIRKRPDLQPVIRRLLSASPSAVEAVDRLLAMLR